MTYAVALGVEEHDSPGPRSNKDRDQETKL